MTVLRAAKSSNNLVHLDKAAQARENTPESGSFMPYVWHFSPSWGMGGQCCFQQETIEVIG
jgi:hypothetical protein